MLRSSCKTILAAAAFALVGAAAPAALPLYTATFDAAPYTANATINGVDGWTVTGAEARVVTGTGARGSSQFVELSAGAQIDRSFSAISALNSANTVWVEGYFRGAGSDTTLANASYPSTPASAIVHFSAANGIEFLNGDKNDGAGTPVASTVSLNANNWYKVTIRLNFTTSSWDAWVDNVSRATNLGFKSAGVTKLNGFKNLAQNQAFFDSFRVVLPVTGDSNGDTKVDAADATNLLLIASQLPTDPAYDVITRTQGDVAAPFGTINNVDVATLVDNLTSGS